MAAEGSPPAANNAFGGQEIPLGAQTKEEVRSQKEEVGSKAPQRFVQPGHTKRSPGPAFRRFRFFRQNSHFPKKAGSRTAGPESRPQAEPRSERFSFRQ